MRLAEPSPFPKEASLNNTASCRLSSTTAHLTPHQNERHFSVKISPVTPTPHITHTHKTAGQDSFATGSRSATHSTWWVIGKMSASATHGKDQVKACFSPHDPWCGRRERHDQQPSASSGGTGCHGRIACTSSLPLAPDASSCIMTHATFPIATMESCPPARRAPHPHGDPGTPSSSRSCHAQGPRPAPEPDRHPGRTGSYLAVPVTASCRPGLADHARAPDRGREPRLHGGDSDRPAAW